MKLGSVFKHRIAVGILCVLVLAYSIYHVVSIFGEDITTYAAGVTTESTVLSYTGYIFRDEQVLTANKKGISKYYVSDGTKVAEGQKLATVYETNKDMQEYAGRMDRYINVLEKSVSDGFQGVDIIEQREKNADAYDAIIKLLANGEAVGVRYQAEKLLEGMNKVGGLINGGETDAKALLENLREERDALFASSGSSSTYTAARPGYFFSGSDGCEEMFTMDAAKDLDFESFYELMDYASNPETEPGAYGRLGNSSEWRIVLPIIREDVIYFDVGETYLASFSQNNGVSIPLSLEKIVTEDGEDGALLVFFCDRQPSGFNFGRCQGVTITVSTVSGLYVPKDVVVREEGTKGVYILRGSVVYFRYMEVIYEGSDYYLVRADSEDEEGIKYLRENDRIILTGQNLFDGRVLD